MTDAINNLFLHLKIKPVLVDVGASEKPPEIWKRIGQNSIYIGFDPDLRDIYDGSDECFSRAIIINEAVIPNKENSNVAFYLTKSPHCSSTLKPDTASLKNFLFSDFFSVEKEQQVQATTLNSVIERLALSGISWLKTDSQGIDLQIFNSLSDNIRNHVMAIDIEPGLINAYIGEDLFIDAHKSLDRQGFWLSNLNVCGAIRIKHSVLEILQKNGEKINRELLKSYHKKSPAWCEARYFRTTDWLSEKNIEDRDYILLWVFSLLDQQYGFALELVFEYEKKFGKDQVAQIMYGETLQHLKRIQCPTNLMWKTVKSVIPSSTKKWLKHVLMQQH